MTWVLGKSYYGNFGSDMRVIFGGNWKLASTYPFTSQSSSIVLFVVVVFFVGKWKQGLATAPILTSTEHPSPCQSSSFVVVIVVIVFVNVIVVVFVVVCYFCWKVKTGIGNCPHPYLTPSKPLPELIHSLGGDSDEYDCGHSENFDTGHIWFSSTEIKINFDQSAGKMWAMQGWIGSGELYKRQATLNYIWHAAAAAPKDGGARKICSCCWGVKKLDPGADHQ